MNHTKDDKPDFELLAKYLAGESTPEEAIKIDDWILSSENHRLLFEQLAASWQGVTEDLLQQSKRPAPLYKIDIFRLGIAASLLVLSGALWLLLSTPQKKLSTNTPLSTVTYITKQAGNSILRDTLPDNSVVVQNVHSVLQYRGDFNRDKRNLQLKGEAWFNVTPNTSKPFLVNIGNIRVIVLGTSFNVQQNAFRIEVSVKTGSVMMHSHSDSLIVKTGQKGVYDILENKFISFNSFNVNDQGYATKILIFENSKLKEIAAQIEKAYGVKVVFRDEKLKNLTMSSSFDNDKISDIFDVISVTLHLNYTIENNVVYISGT